LDVFAVFGSFFPLAMFGFFCRLIAQVRIHVAIIGAT
jgi:hypothetical protein